MKIRNGFVSNSSSSSFMIHRRHLTWEQDELIQLACGDIAEASPTGWSVVRTYGTLICFTIMDNFNMKEYLEKIGVDLNKVHWSSHDIDINDEIDPSFIFSEEYDSVYESFKKKAKKIMEGMDYNDYSKTEK